MISKFGSPGSSGCRRSSEGGFIQALSALTLFVIILLMFFAVQYAHNTVMGLYYSRVLVSMVQNQQSAPDELSSYQTGSVIARLHGIPGVLAIGGAQTVSVPGESDLTITMQHDGARRPAREYARIERSITLLNNFLGILGPQQHIVELTGTSEDSTVYQEFDVSMSMTGPFTRSMINNHIRSFGINIDPNVENPNPALRDPFSPIDTSAATGEARTILGHQLRSRLPIYFSGFRAWPREFNDLHVGHRNDTISSGPNVGQPIYQGAETLLPDDVNGVKHLLCDVNRTVVNPLSPEQINQPGYRSEIFLPISNQRIKLAPWDECVLPWDYTDQFFTPTEQEWCGNNSSPSVGELAGTGCATQKGMNRILFSDFWTDYKAIVEGYVLQVDKVARQVLGVFSGGTAWGPATIGGEVLSGNTILWDGTDFNGTNPLLPDAKIYGLPIDMEQTFYQTIGATKHYRNINYMLAESRRLKMRLLYPYSDPAYAAQYAFLEPHDNAERLAILNGSKILDAVPSPDAPPFALGGYNTYELRPNLMPYSWLNFFGWFSAGDIIVPGTSPRSYFPMYGDTIRPPEPSLFSIDSSWRYDLPPYQNIDPSNGQQNGSIYDPTTEKHPNYALPILKALAPTLGGTDLRKAVQDAAIRRQAELLALQPGQKKKGILVLASDGIPDLEGCSSHLPSQYTCAPVPFAAHLDLIKDALDDFEAGGNTLVILLHMLPSGAVANPHVNEFAALFKPDSPSNVNPSPEKRFYIDLNYDNPTEFGERLQYTLQSIFQIIESFAQFEN